MPVLASVAQQFFAGGHQLHAHGCFQWGAGGDEVVLHVDHNDRRAAGVDLINLNSHFILLWFVHGRATVYLVLPLPLPLPLPVS